MQSLRLFMSDAARAEPLPLSLQLAFMPQWSLSQHNPWSGCLSPRCFRNLVLVLYSPHAAFWITFSAIPQRIAMSQLPSRTCLHSRHHIGQWTAVLIGHVCPPEVAKCSFWRIDHCCVCWLCCCGWCWILQDMDNMEASRTVYVKVSMFSHYEQSEISLLAVNKPSIAKLIVQHN
jgi:hypothetical protein